MKKLALLASFAVASSAFAMDTTMNLKGRFDYVNSEVKKAGAATTSEGKYKPSYLRWATGAKFNDTTSLKLTLDFTDSAKAVTNGFSEFVDEAYMTKSLGNGFSVMIGKQAVLVGGRESDISSRDIYGTSLFSKFSRNLRLTGLTLGYNVAGQDFYVQHLQGENNKNGAGGNTVEDFSDKRMMGVTWYGNLMNDMIKPIVSYHKEGTDEAGAYNTLMAIGAQVNYSQLTFEVDYLTFTADKFQTTPEAELTSIVAHVRYNHDMYRPFFKYIKEDGEKYDMEDGVNANETERSVMELGLEIVPNKDEDFRYHVVYSAAEKKNSTGAENKHEDTKIYAGVAFGMNILK